MSELFAIPWTVACQAPLSMGFSRQEYWSGLPFPFPRETPLKLISFLVTAFGELLPTPNPSFYEEGVPAVVISLISVPPELDGLASDSLGGFVGVRVRVTDC